MPQLPLGVGGILIEQLVQLLQEQRLTVKLGDAAGTELSQVKRSLGQEKIKANNTCETVDRGVLHG